MTTIDPHLSRYRVTQLVDLCQARANGVATPAQETAQETVIDPQALCTTFQSLIFGNSSHTKLD